VHEQNRIRGKFYDPLAGDEIVAKFKDNASLTVDSAAADELIRLVLEIEEVSSVASMTETMAGRVAVAV
jgi:hypothetical protein